MGSPSEKDVIPIDIYPTSSEDATWTITADTDLDTATADVQIGGSWHPLTWVAAATTTGTEWTRQGRLLVRGADAALGVEVTADDYNTDTRVTVGGQVIVRESTLKFRLKT